MCKFTNRLFAFAIISIFSNEFFVETAITRLKNKPKNEKLEELLAILMPDNDYNLHYDQRQKGEENLRIKLDGFFVGLPAPESSEITMLSDDFLENLGEELLLGLGKSRVTTTSPEVYSYSSVGGSYEASKTDKAALEIPAPQKDIETLRNMEPKVTSERQTARSKSKFGHLLGFLLNRRRLGAMAAIDKKVKF